jgi:hypothetical protein
MLKGVAGALRLPQCHCKTGRQYVVEGLPYKISD